MNKNTYLFYMANLGPEIGRMQSFSASGNKEAYRGAKERSFEIINQALKMPDLSLGGQTEISMLKEVLTEADEKTIFEIKKYCEPFAVKFMATFST